MGKIITLNVMFYIKLSILYPIYYETKIVHRITINYTGLCSANIIYAQNAYILN